MRDKISLRPLTKCESTEAAFCFRFKWIALMVSYIGRLVIGSMVGFVKDPIMSELDGLILVCWDRGRTDGVNQFKI